MAYEALTKEVEAYGRQRALKIGISSVDELFPTAEQLKDDGRERITEIPIDQLHPFKDHPFKLGNEDELRALAESIAENGVVTPAIVRTRKDGGYELIAEHRRRAACRMARLETMPALIREMDDDIATIIMVDSNRQRENLLPSEKAFAYKMRLEAMKYQGKTTCDQLGHKSRTLIAEQGGENSAQIQRISRYESQRASILQFLFSHLTISVESRNIVASKVSKLSRRGYSFRSIEHRNDFLK